jgi:hypothetical protein
MIDSTVRAEPSMGIVSFSRISAGGKGIGLFGSEIMHDTAICMRVYHGAEERRLNASNYTFDYDSGIRPVIELLLSPLQFSELLTTMNVGSGVPCTIKYTELTGGVEHKPSETNARTQAQSELREKSRKIASSLNALLASLNDKTLSQSKRTAQYEQARMIKQEIESNLPYLMEMYSEAMDKVAVDCKSEVEAFVLHRVIETGLTALKSVSMNLPEPLQLEEPK